MMVGDKEHDVFGARRAGLECIAVSYGYGTEEELENAHPYKIVNSAEEILDFSPKPQKKAKTSCAGMEMPVPNRNPFCYFPRFCPIWECIFWCGGQELILRLITNRHLCSPGSLESWHLCPASGYTGGITGEEA